MKKTLFSILLFFVSSYFNIAFAINTSNTYYTDETAKNITSKTRDLKPKVLKLAIKAFNQAKSHGINIKKPVITVIDYTLESTKKRLWVINLDNKEILHTSMVAHGKYSGENHTKNFSNQIGSLQTSLGLFLTEDTYFGRDGYSLRLQGLEKGFNDNAKERTIVLHGAPYVSKEFASKLGRVGRSWGCPAVEKPLAKPIIETIKNGTLIFSFYNDSQWLGKSKFLNTSSTNI